MPARGAYIFSVWPLLIHKEWAVLSGFLQRKFSKIVRLPTNSKACSPVTKDRQQASRTATDSERKNTSCSRSERDEYVLEEPAMTQTSSTTIGDLISMFYSEFMEMYGDEELASVATAAVINDLLTETEEEEVAIAA